MAETHNWWSQIEQTDGQKGRSTKEQTAIDFLNKNRTQVSTELFAKLVAQTTEIIKRKDIKTQEIQGECQKALCKLSIECQKEKIIPTSTVTPKELSWSEKASNLSINRLWNKADNLFFDRAKKEEQKVNKQLGLPENNDLKKIGFSEKGLHKFNNDEGNTFVSIKEFETELKTKSISDINSLGLANYFKYLDSKGMMKPEILVQKFSHNSLIELGKLWGKGNKKKDENGLIAKNMLEKSGLGYVVNTITTISSPGAFFEKVQTFDPKSLDFTIMLLTEQGTELRKRIKAELRPQFEKSKTLEKREIDTTIDKMLTEMSAVKGIQQIGQIGISYENQYNIELNITSITRQVRKMQTNKKETDMAQIQKTKSQTKDQKVRDKCDQSINTIRGELIERKREDLVLAHLKEEGLRRLANEEITMKQMVTQLQKEDKTFAKEYKAWQKEKTSFDKENPEVTTKEKSLPQEEKSEKATSHQPTPKDIPFSQIKDGEVYPFSLGQESINTNNITREGDNYKIQIGNHTNNTITLPKEKVKTYLASLQFLEDAGLGYFIRHLSQEQLRQTLQASSTDTTQVNTQDGKFEADEKIKVLHYFGKLLGIKGAEKIQNPEDGKQFFQDSFSASGQSLQSRLLSGSLIQNNGSLNVTYLTNFHSRKIHNE